MGAGSKIEWTDHTFNPWWGCAKVSPGCNNCYADSFSRRVGQDVWGANAPRRLFGEKHWAEPLKWNEAAQKAGRMALVFCASMADVFEDRRDLDEQRARPLEPDRQDRPSHLDLIPPPWREGLPDNVWIGTSVEDQQRADSRIPHLLDIPAMVRFLSCEPLIGPVNFDDVPVPVFSYYTEEHTPGPLEGSTVFVRGVDWVIVGGESGPRARPMHPDWVYSIWEECEANKVPFFFKQWGEYGFDDIGQFRRLGKKRAGRELWGRTWDQIPDVLLEGVV